MKLVVQRALESNVEVNNQIVGKIDKGFVVLCGITHDDTEKEADVLARKLCNLRVFHDENGKMNLSIKDVNGEILAISQFTLYADPNSGNRPSFINAMKPDPAEALYQEFVKILNEEYQITTKKGVFGAHMELHTICDGPVTINLEF